MSCQNRLLWLPLLLSLCSGSAQAAAVAATEQEMPPASESIVADVSSRRIALTAGFSGADTTLFGALPENGDVIVTVTGPLRDAVVRRKERVMGVWINRSDAEFGNVPGFYWIASSRPIGEMASEEWLAARRIGINHLRFNVRDASDYRSINVYLDALIDLSVRRELYFFEPASVTIMGGRLYRADVHIPADAPPGEYALTTYLLQNGQLQDVQKTSLSLNKQGVMAQVSMVAEKNSLVYALMAITLALLAGWSSAVLMQRS